MTGQPFEDPSGIQHSGPHPPVPTSRTSPPRTLSQTQRLSSASSYANLNYLFGLQEPAMIAPKPNRNRRKSNQGSEHTKHRRTRSGCFTCRSRRVKCDEQHPVCERCRKGGRECVYPDPPSSSKVSGSVSSKTPQVADCDSPGSSSDDVDEGGGSERLEVIPDEDEDEDEHEDDEFPQIASNYGRHPSSVDNFASDPRYPNRQDSETPSLIQDKGASPTPSTEGSVGYSTYQTAGNSRQKRSNSASAQSSAKRWANWSHLPQDVQFYLTYFCKHITHLHYSLKNDSSNFLHTTFLDFALTNDALLYAIVGFAAFQQTLNNPTGRIQDFLQYYNKSVSLLLHSLKRGERHTEGTMLAILQLATIEEFLGDWVNLLGHQKAAYQILTELYSPQTVMNDQKSRVILGWYQRFDVFAGLMGGFETVLSRGWFSAAVEFTRQQAAREPESLDWKIDLAISRHRLVAMDMSLLFAKMGRGEVSLEQFVKDNEVIGARIGQWKTNMDPALQDSRYLVMDFSSTRPVDPDDIVDPYEPGIIYSGPLFPMNIATIDWLSIDIMHKYQTALTLRTQPSAELTAKAYTTCRLFEAVELWHGSPPGSIVACQASLGIACLFLPRDNKHSMWARRKLATIESNGYIYPYTFRTKMADLFRDRSCMHWWLPNDERYPPIIRSIRKFVQERTSHAKNMPAEDLRDMKAIFSSLTLGDTEPNLPQEPLSQGRGSEAVVAVAPNQDRMQSAFLRESDTQPLGHEGHGYWDQHQGARGKPDGYL